MSTRTIIDAFLENVENNGQRHLFSFLADGDTVSQSVTYSELADKSARLAGWLKSRSLTGQRVLLVFGPGIEFVEAYLGCLMSGAVAVPIAPALRTTTDRHAVKTDAVVADCAPALVLGTALTLARVRHTLSAAEGRLQPLLQDVAEIDWSLQKPDLGNLPGPDDLAMLQYTSGSTSAPKGVMLTHRNVLHNVTHFDEYWQHDAQSRLVSWLPHFHDLGLLYGLLFPLYKGIDAYLLPPAAVVQKPVRWLRAISAFGGTHSMGPNFIYDLCARSIIQDDMQGLDLSGWRFALNAAEPVRAETIRHFNQRFASIGLNPHSLTGGYGLAEAACRVTAGYAQKPISVLRIDVDALSANRVSLRHEPGPRAIDVVGCGYTALGTEFKIVHPEHCTECKADEVGEIWVRSGSVAQGYWQRPEQSAQTFQGLLHSGQDQGPYLRTGDMGFVHQQELFITGRIKDLVIIRGENYYPHDIEQTVEDTHPALRRSCGAVFSVDTDGAESIVVVQEVKKLTAQAEMEAIHQAIRQAVAREHDLPVYSIVLIRAGSISKTSSGKIQRAAVRAAYLQGKLDVAGQWCRLDPVAAEFLPSPPKLEADHVTAFLLDRMSQLASVPRADIQIDAPFADLGLGSLDATTLSAALAGQFGIQVSPTAFYDYPNIRALSQALTQQRGAQQPGGPTRRGDEIAVIGIGCRFPGAANPDAYWRLLLEGRNAISERTEPGGQIRKAAFLPDIAQFDHRFFGISKREAETIDPQQRLALEVAWEALEDACIVPGQLAGSPTGVFFGASAFDYGALQLSQGELDAYTGQGSLLGVVANRLSYLLDLHGPSLVVDTACSSALTALHLACRSLADGECDLALSGGVNALLAPQWDQALASAGMLSADGQCKTFDAHANGYVRGEGGGVVVLKRYQEALRDGNHIYGVILGTAINQDGKSNGLTAPNGAAQESLLRRALQRAGLTAGDLDYIEAHGTGTPLGDPIECGALSRVLSERVQACWLGSVKANIGHLEAAAGIAGLIKVMLSIKAQQIVPQVNLGTLNPLIELGGSLRIPDRPIPWPAGTGRRRCASISAFGFSGTNANALVAEAPLRPAAAPMAASHRALPFVLSGGDSRALARAAASYLDQLRRQDDLRWVDAAYGACCKRTNKGLRLAFVADDRDALMGQLQTWAAPRKAHSASAPGKPRIAFVFSGQGMPLAGIGADLYTHLPAFKEAIDQCDALLAPHFKRPVMAMIAGDDPALQAGDPGVVQPVQFVLQHALVQGLRSFGITPDLVMGHSLGEYAAWCAAGSIGLEDALRIVLARGQLTRDLCGPGLMAAVFASADDLAHWISQAGSPLDIAVVNGHAHCVIAGTPDHVQTFCATTLDAQGVAWRVLPMQRAYHSRLLDTMLPAFTAVADSVRYRAPHIEVFSNLTGQVWPSGRSPDSTYFTRHVREAVRFDKCLDHLAESTELVCVEIGSKPTLSRMAALHLADRGPAWVTPLRHDGEDWSALLACLTQVHTHGADVKWDVAFHGLSPRMTPLPTYPFSSEHAWFTPRVGQATSADEAPPSAAQAPLHRLDDETMSEPRSVEAALTVLLARLRKCSPQEIDSRRTFFEMGLDSLVLMELARTASRDFGLPLRLHELADKTPTLRHLADYIASNLVARSQ